MKRFDTIYRKVECELHKPEVKKKLFVGSIWFTFTVLLLSLFVSFINPNKALAQPYKMKTGKYVGSGGGRTVSGLGFTPELVILKATTADGVGALFKTTAMPDNITSYLGAATADDGNGLISLDVDGFSLSGTNVNTPNINWTWMAFAGSDCSSSGTFCVGTYTGTTGAARAITTGFAPALEFVKRSTAVAPTWRSAIMPVNYAQYFTALAQDTAGSFLQTEDATSFTVGATNNVAAGIYHYVAFKSVAGSINIGSFLGNGTSKSISPIGFEPDAVFMKNADAGTAVGAVYNVSQSYGNSSSYFADTANVVGAITALQSDGFSVGAHATANGSGNTIYWVAFGGAAAPSSSGTFKMASGSYVGNGEYKQITNVGFTPDLVIIKGDTTSAGVFRTYLHSGDITSCFDATSADFALGIQSINPDGFSVGTSATVNSNNLTYYWTAYGNAWRPGTNSGASDFAIGSYYGNGVTDRDITSMPFSPNLVVIKRSTAVAGIFRTTEHSGDSSSYFTAAADAAGNIKAINSDGFRVGTNTNVNAAAGLYWYFAFKNGSNFTVDTYDGSGSAKNVDTVGFQPDNLWIKAIGATRGVMRTSDGATDSAIPFTNVAAITGAVTSLRPAGFSVGTVAETNTSGTANYRYVAWKKNVGVTLTVGTTGTQSASMNIPSTNNYVGGAFTFVTDTSSSNITSISITDTGTVNANANISNLDLYYETAGTCTYDGNETLFGTAANFNSSEEATVTGTMFVSTSQVCLYAVVDVGSGASNNDTLDLEITNSQTDVAASVLTVLPSTPVVIAGTTTLSVPTNNPPNAPTSLTQGSASGQNNISESAWTKYNTPHLGFSVSDPDSGNTVKYRVQVDGTSNSFANLVLDYTYSTFSTSGTVFDYQIGQSGGTYAVGSQGMTLTDSGTGYWWRVQGIDNLSAASGWSTLGTTAVDYKMDASAPTGLIVYDGTTIGSDTAYNNGSLTQLSANWTAANFNLSGTLTPNKYQYAIGTTSGGTDILTWQATNTESAAVNATSLNLHTGQIYYWVVNAYDNAGNIATVVSNGQQIMPSLSFSFNPSTITFDTLNNGNNWTNSQPITTTTSTNAQSGYSIYGYINDYMRSVPYSSTYINDVAFTYASPQLWPLGTYGFGYTSNGAARYSGGTLYCAFNHSVPGDVIAGHTAAVNGSTGPVSAEQFTITSKIAVASSQRASAYKTTLYLIVAPNF